jgi:hypothetical protein
VALLLRVQAAALDGEHQHLAERRHDGREAAGHARRQQVRDLVQPLVDLRPGPIDVGALRKLEGHEGVRIAGGRAHLDEVGDALHRPLDGHRDPRFQLLGRQAGGAHRNQDLHRRHVGEGVDRKLAVRVAAPNRDRERGEQGDQRAAQRRVHQSA